VNTCSFGRKAQLLNVLIGLLGILVIVANIAILERMLWRPAMARRKTQLCKALATAVNLRCPGYMEWASNCALLCQLVGSNLGFNEETLISLNTAALLRGIGLCAIPFNLIQPGAKEHWSSADKYVFEKHVDASRSMLLAMPNLRWVAKYLEPRDEEGIDFEVNQAKSVLQIASDYCWHVHWDGPAYARQILLQTKSGMPQEEFIRLLLQVIPSDGIGATQIAV